MTNKDHSEFVFKVGDIVLAPFPFADHSVTKLRPAVIVSSLPNAAWLVIYVTSSTDNETDYDVILKPNDLNNLKVTSVARVNRLTVIATQMIERQLGTLSKEERDLIAKKLGRISENFLEKHE